MGWERFRNLCHQLLAWGCTPTSRIRREVGDLYLCCIIGIMKFLSKNVRTKFIWGAICSLLLIVAIGVSWLYLFALPHHVDREVFKLIKVPYSSESVLYEYAESDVVAGVYVKISRDDVARMRKDAPPAFSVCSQLADVQCTQVWVPTSKYMPQRYGPDDAQNISLYKQVVGGGSMCSYAIRSNEALDDPGVVAASFTRSKPFVKDLLCVNPENGYVMYVKIRT